MPTKHAYRAAVGYVARVCTPADDLPTAIGLSQGEFDRLQQTPPPRRMAAAPRRQTTVGADRSGAP